MMSSEIEAVNWFCEEKKRSLVLQLATAFGLFAFQLLSGDAANRGWHGLAWGRDTPLHPDCPYLSVQGGHEKNQ